MADQKLVAVPCRLAPGMFRSERLFSVTMANGQEHQGIAPADFCWNGKGKLVSKDDVSVEDGMIAARIVEALDNEQVAVELPDGEVVSVREDDVRDRPTPIKPPEPKPNVPLRP